MLYSKSSLFSQEYVTPVCKTRTMMLERCILGGSDFEEIIDDEEEIEL